MHSLAFLLAPLAGTSTLSSSRRTNSQRQTSSTATGEWTWTNLSWRSGRCWPTFTHNQYIHLFYFTLTKNSSKIKYSFEWQPGRKASGGLVVKSESVHQKLIHSAEKVSSQVSHTNKNFGTESHETPVQSNLVFSVERPNCLCKVSSITIILLLLLIVVVVVVFHGGHFSFFLHPFTCIKKTQTTDVNRNCLFLQLALDTWRKLMIEPLQAVLIRMLLNEIKK